MKENIINKKINSWTKSIRIKIIQRDNDVCVLCGNSFNVIHHIEKWADNIANRFEITNLVLLCKDCHKKVHKFNCKLEPNPILTNKLTIYINNISNEVNKCL